MYNSVINTLLIVILSGVTHYLVKHDDASATCNYSIWRKSCVLSFNADKFMLRLDERVRKPVRWKYVKQSSHHTTDSGITISRKFIISIYSFILIIVIISHIIIIKTSRSAALSDGLCEQDQWQFEILSPTNVIDYSSWELK